MATTSPDYDHHQKSFRIKHDDDKFFTRLLSKESSKSNPSFRVYYGDHVPSAVPFMWETRPGTPKHTSSHNSHIPPLTPPPSYYTNNLTNSNNHYSRSKLLFRTFLGRIHPKKPHSPSSHSPTSSFPLFRGHHLHVPPSLIRSSHPPTLTTSEDVLRAGACRLTSRRALGLRRRMVKIRDAQC
ncbi:hypothetical protein Sango_1441200 [Sesamum angolense]|uniref:Uncharacterized protein n=1 Tax=Sesamum angolense TaxID=2727404 RepID=A0AAE1WMK3_9LAMI|nr:hypothetical protein Sango_1441200 [Sesamum angolense]